MPEFGVSLAGILPMEEIGALHTVELDEVADFVLLHQPKVDAQIAKCVQSLLNILLCLALDRVDRHG